MAAASVFLATAQLCTKGEKYLSITTVNSLRVLAYLVSKQQFGGWRDKLSEGCVCSESNFPPICTKNITVKE